MSGKKKQHGGSRRSRQAGEAVSCELWLRLRRDYLKFFEHYGFILTTCNYKNKDIRTLHSNLLFNLLLASSLYLLCVHVYIALRQSSRPSKRLIFLIVRINTISGMYVKKGFICYGNINRLTKLITLHTSNLNNNYYN